MYMKKNRSFKRKFLLAMKALELFSHLLGQLALIGLILSALQMSGLLTSLIFLLKGPPWSYLPCVESFLCLFSSTISFSSAPLFLFFQSLYSIIAIGANVCLMIGTLTRAPWFLLPWLLLYVFSGVLGKQKV